MSRFRTAILVGAALLISISASADKLTDILNKHYAAMGGTARLSAVRSIMMRGSVELGGIKMDYVEYYLAPNLLRQDQTYAGRSNVLVFDGSQAWSQDMNGKVTRQTGEEGRSTRTEVFAFSLQYIANKSLWKHYRLVGRDAKTGEHILEFAPPECKPVKLAIDERTHLVNSAMQTTDGEVSVNTQSDYRLIGGIPFAYRMRISNGKKEFDQTVIIEEAQVNSGLHASLFAKPDARHDYVWKGAQKFTSLPFEFNGDHLFTKIKVNDQEANVLIDTGAGTTVLTSRTVKKLGLKPEGKFEVRGGGGSTSGAVVNGVTFSTENLTLASQSVTQLDLPLVSGFGRQIGGILGYDFFSRFVVVLDYEKRLMTLFDPDAYRPEKVGKTVAMELDGRTPVVAGSIDGIPLKFRLDTGANGTASFDHAFVKKNKLKDRYPNSLPSMSAGAGGVFTETRHRVKRLNIGRFDFRDVIVNFSDNEKGVSGEYVQGNVGNEILSQFMLVFDYPKERLTFIPTGKYGKFTEEYRIGISMADEDGKVVISMVAPRSAAEKAGVKGGDQLVSINGVSLTGKTTAEARALFDSSRKQEYALALLREGKPVSVKVASARLLE